jgi:hypothetical protein
MTVTVGGTLASLETLEHDLREPPPENAEALFQTPDHEETKCQKPAWQRKTPRIERKSEPAFSDSLAALYRRIRLLELKLEVWRCPLTLKRSGSALCLVARLALVISLARLPRTPRLSKLLVLVAKQILKRGGYPTSPRYPAL